MASVIRQDLVPASAITAATTNGESKNVELLQTDFLGYIVVSAINAATTVNAKIQDSADGTNWNDVVSFTALAGVTGYEKKDITAKLFPYVRAVVTLSGATKSATVAISLHSDKKR